jgi:hypothetical protein
MRKMSYILMELFEESRLKFYLNKRKMHVTTAVENDFNEEILDV